MNAVEQLTIELTIARLTKERDEARRMYCSKVEDNSHQYGIASKDVAKQLNWDCFEEVTQ